MSAAYNTMPSLLPENYDALVRDYLSAQTDHADDMCVWASPARGTSDTSSAGADAPGVCGDGGGGLSEAVVSPGSFAEGTSEGDVLVVSKTPPVDKRSMQELRVACHAAGLPATGRKAVLTERLAAQAASASQSLEGGVR
jgi:hypothetical protein